MASPRILSYSYKPVTGFSGASTVVPLKNGSFLEVRRGEKTRWVEGDFRNTWATLDAWKATLPVGAVVVEKKTSDDMWSSEFRIIINSVKELCNRNPESIRYKYTTNLDKANSYIRRAKLVETKERLKGNTDPTTSMRYVQLRNLAIVELSKAPYRIIQPILPRPLFTKQGDIYVQRICDGEFTKLYFDLRTGLFIMLLPGGNKYMAAPTIEQLGAHPLFQVYTSANKPQLMSFETTIQNLNSTTSRATSTSAASTASTGASTTISSSTTTTTITGGLFSGFFKGRV